MIGIVVALESECAFFLEKIEDKKEFLLADKKSFSGKVGGKDIILSISGIGKVSAALTTQLIIDKYNPDYIINFGTCGGVNNSVEILKYYFVEKTIQYDFDVTEIDDVDIGYIQEYKRKFFPCITDGFDFLEKRVLGSADRFTDDPDIITLLNNIGCAIRDFEGSAISQVCLSNSTPLIMIKGISDVVGSQASSEQFVNNLKKVAQGFPDVVIKTISRITK